MQIDTTRFGMQEVAAGKIIEMPDGMVGFGETRFAILDPAGDGPFLWFQAVDHPNLAFVVVDPLRFVPDYHVDLTADERNKLLLEPDEEPALLAVVTMSSDPQQITINLQGPIVLNPTRMIARQVVLEGRFTMRHHLFPPDVPG